MEVMGAVGLAQNFSAIRALSTEGIQQGHMTLHARTVANAAGATPDIYDEVVESLAVFDAEWASRTDAGVLTVLNDSGDDAYGIIRRPEVPAALVEMAYLSNPTAAVVIGTSEYRQAAAQAVADAAVRFLETPDPGAGLIAEPRLFNPSDETGGTDGCVDPALD